MPGLCLPTELTETRGIYSQVTYTVYRDGDIGVSAAQI